MATSITFNSVDLNDGSIYVTSNIDHTQPFERNMPVFNIARSHGGIITDNTYGIKKIPHTGRIHGTSAADVQSKMDTFNNVMSGFGKNLDIGFGGTTRRYVATASKAHAWQPITASSWAEFEIEYTVTEWGRDTSATTLINAVTNTTTSYSPVLTIGGSAPEQPLLISITVTAATSFATKTITVTSPSGTAISIRRNWAVSDILIIDEAALKSLSGQPVTVNGNPVNFTGYFPNLGPSASTQTLVITNDFGTRTLTYTISQIKRWL